MTSTTKTMRAPILWDNANIITCTSDGSKDLYGKAVWYSEDGRCFELIYARLARKYSFNPLPNYNKEN